MRRFKKAQSLEGKERIVMRDLIEIYKVLNGLGSGNPKYYFTIWQNDRSKGHI